MRYPIYEILPMVYMAGGAAAMFGIEALIAKICGGLLFAAGWAVRAMRKEYRKKNKLVDVNTISTRW